MTEKNRIQVIDSHTAGEPTRVVVAGGPILRSGSLAAQRDELRQQADWFRRAVVCEPRGSDVMVGALLSSPIDPNCAASVIFFNNVGYLGMCGHGMIGTVVTLAHLGRLTAGEHRIETPVGVVTVTYDGGHRVAVENVPSYRYRRGVSVTPVGYPPVTGDIAWGGNWFFLVADHQQVLDPKRTDSLVDYTWRIRMALRELGITGADGAEIDHIELFGPASSPTADSKNFVLCPGKAYDRSPCGTGTSAKIACLMDDARLVEGETWRQEGILGSVFEASGRRCGDRVVPTISGHAYITAEVQLVLDPHDPYRAGIP